MVNLKTQHILYPTWKNMNARCYQKNNPSYKYYGGRGIQVCDEWRDSETFLTWIDENLGLRPEGFTLDRIDNDGDYEPGNVKWSNQSEQCINRRSTVLLTYDGQTHLLEEWSQITGLSFSVLYDRIHRGWTVERILTQIPRKRRIK